MAGTRIEKTETGCRPGQWFGPWAILPEALQSYLATVQASDIKAAAAASAGVTAPAYTVSSDGLATINITGPIAKYGSSFQSLIGGASTLEKRQALRQAVRDPEVRAVMLRIDSPGGTVAGTGDLADAIAKADASKPVYAYIEDLGASAAYRLASRARAIYANADAQVGSIGTYTVLTDTSGAYAKEGVKVTVVRSGAFKGAGEEGTAVTDEQIAEAQRRVDALNQQFLNDVSAGRRMPMEKVKTLADGRVHMAAAAKGLGLIDGVASLEEAGRKVMEEVALADAQAELQTEKQRADKAEAELIQLRAVVAAGKAKEELDTMKASLAALKSLPACADGFAEALVQIKGSAPEAFSVLETQIRAWDGQAKVAALFEEKGHSDGRTPEKVDITNPEAYRAAAAKLVKDGKAKDVTEAMKQLLLEHEQGGK